MDACCFQLARQPSKYFDFYRIKCRYKIGYWIFISIRMCFSISFSFHFGCDFRFSSWITFCGVSNVFAVERVRIEHINVQLALALVS